jgi:monovalent cation:H+ antiporter-2, CPA2 family
MATIVFLIAAATFGFGIATWLKVPAVPLLIISGISMQMLGLVDNETQLQQTLLLGLTFLVFVMGTELNPARVGLQSKGALLVGFIQFIVLGTASFFVVSGMGVEPLPALYLALAVTASSTLVVVRLLQQRRQLFEPFGRLVIGVLLIQDVLVILFISILANADQGLIIMSFSLIKIIGLILFSIALQKWFIPYIIISLGLDEETLLLVVLAVLFAFVALAYWLELPFIAGAFCAGFSLSGFPVHGVVRGQLTSISDFFVAIFFVSLGGSLFLPSWEAMKLAAAMIILVITLTPPLVLFIAERTGLSTRASIEAGLLLAQTSEFSLIIALIGFENGHIDQQLVAVTVLVTVITMILTPFVATDAVAWRLTHIRPNRRVLDMRFSNAKNHILLLGCGQSGLQLLDDLKALNTQIIVIDDDPAVVNHLSEDGIDVIRGDAADIRILKACNAQSAKIIISTLRRVKDNEKMLKFIHGIPTIVRVFEEEDAERIRKCNGTPVLYSHLASEEFINWFKSSFKNKQKDINLHQ